MNTIARITGVFRTQVGDELFDDLVRIYPAGQTGAARHAFRLILNVDDLRTQSVRQRLADGGYTPWTETARPIVASHEYCLDLVREYDEADLADCALLQLAPPSDAYNYGAYGRADDGNLVVPEQQMPGEPSDVLFGGTYSYFVPARVKSLIDQASLVGVRFRPTYYGPRDLSVDDTPETIRERHGIPYWEIDSDRRMPPLSPSMVLVDRHARRVAPGSAGPCSPRDGLHVMPELRYRSRDLAALPAFDLARTHEDFEGFNAPGDRPLIASRRFYEFFRENGLHTGWVPVRIDRD